MATPSVWRQVRALEDDYGVQLVAAQGHDVRLTEDGERLVDLAAPLVEGFDSLKKVFHDEHGKAERHLRMAAPATVLNSTLRHIIADYRRTHPQVRLSLIDAPSRIAWQLLEAEKADLAIVGTPSRWCALPAIPLPRSKPPNCVTSSNNRSSSPGKTQAHACSLITSSPKPG
jgi:DNA-binding transcriptional LysR family regulator